MRVRLNRSKWPLIGFLYAWLCLLSAAYMWNFWRLPVVAGIDGSGHVAALHLYAKNIYPNLQGWIPEFFTGMPFPTFYPPLFYWVGATLMRVTGLEAMMTVRILTTASLVALPITLFWLARRLGLSRITATGACALAVGLICGSTIPALFGIGLGGLFEIGLYTHSFGFIWLCLWCGALPHARRSPQATLLAIIALAAVILSNAHILPLAAAYGIAWFVIDTWQQWRYYAPSNKRVVLVKALKPVSIAIASFLIAGVWLIPLIDLQTFSVGRSLPVHKVFFELFTLNVFWLACIWVAWKQCRRRPALAALSIALLIIGITCITPLGRLIPVIPFQPLRVISGAIVLSSLPVAFICEKALRRLNQQKRIGAVVGLGLLCLDWIYPPQQFWAASLSSRREVQLQDVRSAMKDQPPGMVMVEIVASTETRPLDGPTPSEISASRAMAHQLAMDGRPVIWGMFREHAVSAPYLTAIRNLFSFNSEQFGIDGVALHQAEQGKNDLNRAVALARASSLAYYLVKSPEEIARLKGASELSHVWEIMGWNLFISTIPPAPPVQAPIKTPVLAWLPAHFRNRSPYDVDFFNVGEQLAFSGQPEVSMLWAFSRGAAVWELVRQLPQTIMLVDPSAIASDQDAWIKALESVSSKLSVILIDDGSQLSMRIHERSHFFAGYEYVRLEDYQVPERLNEIVLRVTRLENSLPAPLPGVTGIWRVNQTYFPTWELADGSSPWLTAQGQMAALSSQPPVLRWRASPWQSVGKLSSVLGLGLALGLTVKRKLRPLERFIYRPERSEA